MKPRRALHLRREEAEARADRRRASSLAAGPTRRPASTRTRWTSCTSTSSRPCRPTTASAATSTTWSTRTRSSSSTSSPAGRCPTATGARGCTRPSRPRKACRSPWPADHAAQITFQSYFRLYKKLAGMTGTAAQNWLGDAPRLQALGGVRADQPAGHPRALARPRLPDRGRQVRRRGRRRCSGCTTQGRPVLIGTRSVDKSEKLSRAAEGGGHRAPGAQRQAARAGGEDRRRRPASRAG